MTKILISSRIESIDRDFTMEIDPLKNFFDVLKEIALRINFDVSHIAIATPTDHILSKNDLKISSGQIIEKYGLDYEIINNTLEIDYTSHPNIEKKYHGTLAERYVPAFAEKWGEIGPRHPVWENRVKLEKANLTKYTSFVKSSNQKCWFDLHNAINLEYNHTVWKGHLTVATRPEITFKFIVLLSSEYPVVIPRAFIEEKAVPYAGKLYMRNTWFDHDEDINYVMLCHDHMEEIKGIWSPDLSIAHFLIREVFIWWAAMQNTIVEEWDKAHHLITEQ